MFLWVLPSGASAYIYISRRDWSRRDVGALMLAVFRILKCHHSKTPQPASSHSQRIKFPRATCGVLRHPSSSHRTHPFVEGRKAAMLFSPRCLRLIQHRTWSTPEPRTPPQRFRQGSGDGDVPPSRLHPPTLPACLISSLADGSFLENKG